MLTVLGLPHVVRLLPDLLTGLQLALAVTDRWVWLTVMGVTRLVGQFRALRTFDRTVNVLTVLGLPHVVSLLPDLLTGFQLALAVTDRWVWLTVVRVAALMGQLCAFWANH